MAADAPPAPSVASDEVFIEARDLFKTYSGQEVLRGINLKVHRGETLVIVGPSGEGKSVLIRHLIGLVKPDSGEITVGGVRMQGLRERQLAPLRRKLGILFQNAALFDSLTVEQNLAFPLLEAGVRDRAEIEKRVHEALEVVELEMHKDKLPVNLSGGMKKRVGIARAIIGRPECILYDEPTSGLDPIVSDVIDKLIMRLQKRFGVTSIVVTHDMKSVFKIANRVALLKGGVIYFCGTTQQFGDSEDKEIQDFIEGRSHVEI